MNTVEEVQRDAETNAGGCHRGMHVQLLHITFDSISLFFRLSWAAARVAVTDEVD